MRARVPRNFKSLDMHLYDKMTNSRHHLSNFKSQMYLADTSDATRYKAFPTTLTKSAMKWFDSLPPRSVTSFDDLARKFLTRFSIQKDKVKHAPSLLGVKQEFGESLRDYMERFNKACLEIQDLPTEAIIMGLVNGLREGPFSQSISKRHCTFLSDVQERDEKKICHTDKLFPPRPIKNKKEGSHNEYYVYHKLYGYSTNNGYDLKNVIEKLAREGRSDRYLMERSDNQGKRKRDDEEVGRRGQPPQTPEQHVHIIAGGFAGGGVTKSSRKRYLKEVYHEEETPNLLTISFTKEDAQEITSGHDDPVVITMILTNVNLHRTLVDQRSSADILFKPTFDKLRLDEKELKYYPNTLFGLGDTPIKPLGFISLHTTFGKGLKSKTLIIDYIVADVASAYNALIGRTTLNRLRAVVSTPHL
ncbi:uncharacterized protein LOC107606785 [Arachis ipaensis]|uniref:uncharacterized protein LOC107606785 n=1 Tax=Arachis ipaensis TaxID=130454 RepID=UPI0007AF4071|nr:uncharacterized protein LOC107606785 [Arachis ipaensis]